MQLQFIILVPLFIIISQAVMKHGVSMVSLVSQWDIETDVLVTKVPLDTSYGCMFP